MCASLHICLPVCGLVDAYVEDSAYVVRLLKLMTENIHTMDYLPLASVATRRFEDTAVTKDILAKMGATIHIDDSFRMSPEAQFAMGWWFYTIDVKPEAIKSMRNYGMIQKDGRKAAEQLISQIQSGMDAAGCDARVRLASKPSIFARYWSWLMK